MEQAQANVVCSICDRRHSKVTVMGTFEQLAQRSCTHVAECILVPSASTRRLFMTPMLGVVFCRADITAGGECS